MMGSIKEVKFEASKSTKKRTTFFLFPCEYFQVVLNKIKNGFFLNMEAKCHMFYYNIKGKNE